MLFGFALVSPGMYISVYTHLYSWVKFLKVYSKCINIWTAVNLGSALDPIISVKIQNGIAYLQQQWILKIYFLLIMKNKAIQNMLFR